MCKDQESIQSSTIPDPRYQWEKDKLTVRHHKGEPRGQGMQAVDKVYQRKSFSRQLFDVDGK